MKKRIVGLNLIFLFGLASTGWSISYTGFISSDTGTLTASSVWGEESTSFSYIVDDTTNNGFYTYDYTFTASDKSLSHVILELSQNFIDDFADGTTDADDSFTSEAEGPGWFSSNNSNPGMPQVDYEESPGGEADIYGYKLNTDEDPLTYEFTIVTDRMPMWGDVYAKDGVHDGENVYAYNSMFGVDTGMSIDTENHGEYGWVLVPDTETDDGGGGGGQQVIPEPTTMLLFGSGLLGLGAFFRRRNS